MLTGRGYDVQYPDDAELPTVNLECCSNAPFKSLTPSLFWK